MKISQVRYGVAKISQEKKELRNFLLACENFAKGKRDCEISFSLTKILQEEKKVAKFPSVLRKFRNGLRNSSVLDSFSDSLPCTLD